MTHTLVTVAREEGRVALFRGAKFAVLRQGTYGTIRLGMFYPGRTSVSLSLRHIRNHSIRYVLSREDERVALFTEAKFISQT